MFVIGIDLDNTIACYDQAFSKVAQLMGLVESAKPVISKAKTKSLILAKVDGAKDWQRLQGKVYGKHIMLANVFSGFHEFLYLSKLRGHKIFIISHKTEFGHFDEERVPLREQAITWLRSNDIFHGGAFTLERQDIFFETTRNEKIKQISQLNCTHFIDDLLEVFDEPFFPSNVKKILFRPSTSCLPDTNIFYVSSWRKLTSKLLGAWTETEIHEVIRERFPDLGISQVERHPGRGNSRVYKLTDNHSSQYFLKIYPDRQLDTRPRLETEFMVCQELFSRAYPVVAPIAAYKNLGWVIYQWIEGDSIEAPDEKFLECAYNFIQRLHFDGPLKSFEAFPMASEACLSGSEVIRQIQERIQSLKKINSEELRTFLNQEFIPCLNVVKRIAKELAGQIFDIPLDRSHQILSPSDFGAHNALRDKYGRVIFIDFEYFGWDDPVKLVSDFYWHPGMILTDDLRRKWLGYSLDLFKRDPTYSIRLNGYLPLFGMRWCVIILNEYLKPMNTSEICEDCLMQESAKKKSKQLLKAKNILHSVKELLNVDG